jgi:hypothetical protein
VSSCETKESKENTMATNIIPATNNSVDTYVPFGGEDVTLGEDAMAPAPEYPLLQYATGLPAQRPKVDAEGYQLYDEETGEALMDNLYYAGFFTQVGVDKALDDAMTLHKVPWLDIAHGGGEVVRHWMIEKPLLFLMAKGIPSNGNSKGEYGIAYLWRQKRNSTKRETVFYAQVVIRQLLPEYSKPFVMTCKSTQTDDALVALKRQYRVLAKAREAMRKAGKELAMPLWTYSFFLGAAKKQDVRGSGADSKPIFPMISGIPDDAPGAYLQKHEVPIELADHFRGLTEKAVEWAKALTERIASGAETHEPWKNGDAAPVEEHPF